MFSSVPFPSPDVILCASETGGNQQQNNKKKRREEKETFAPFPSLPPPSCLSQSDENVRRFPSLPSADPTTTPTTTTIKEPTTNKKQDDGKGQTAIMVFVHNLPEELGECCDALDGVRESWAGPAPMPVGGLPP